MRHPLAKRLELLQAAVPGLSSVTCLWNSSIADRVRDITESQDAARSLGLELRPLAARDERELAGALGHLAAHRPDALPLLDNAVLDTTRRSWRSLLWQPVCP